MQGQPPRVPSAEHLWRLLDAARRVHYNTLVLRGSAPAFGRSRDKVRQFNFANFLSSVYSLQDICGTFCKLYAPEGHWARITASVETDELLNYARAARIAQDHTISAAATQPIAFEEYPIGFFPQGAPPRRVARTRFRLHPITINRGKAVLPVPQVKAGSELSDITPEQLAERVGGWWLTVVDGLTSATWHVPTWSEWPGKTPPWPATMENSAGS